MSFGEKLKIIQNFEAELPMTAEEFRAKMNAKIDREPPGFFSDAYDAWRTHKNDFKGLVEENTIIFKHRHGFLSGLLSLPLVKVSYQPAGKHVAVKTNINAFKGPMIIIVIVAALALVSILAQFVFAAAGVESELTNIPVVIGAMIGLCIAPFIVMRLAIHLLRKKIDQELYEVDQKTTFYR
jgi:hypothetical protein